MFRMEKQRPLKANTSEPKVGAETETEEQQKLKNESMKQSMERESLMRVCKSAMQEYHASVCRIHEHEEGARAPLMRVASEV